MALFNVTRDVFSWTCLISVLFPVARCDFVCSRCGGPDTPIPTSVNIFDRSNGFYLWVNPQGKLSSGAVDINEGSSVFEIHLYNPEDPSSFWIKTAVTSEPETIVAANFSADPSLVVVGFGNPSQWSVAAYYLVLFLICTFVYVGERRYFWCDSTVPI